MEEQKKTELLSRVTKLELYHTGTAAGNIANQVEPVSVYLLGTAHVSKQSVVEASLLVTELKPDVVFVELCDARQGMLRPRKEMPVPTPSQMVEQLQRGEHAFTVLYSYFMAVVAEELGVVPGDEFRAAVEARQESAAVCLGDRHIQVTLQRMWRSLGAWERIKLVFSLLLSGSFLPSGAELSALVEQMKDSDVITQAIKDLGQEFPTVVDTLIRERDLYMVCTLRNCLRSTPPGGSIVAVVGGGHVPGITAHWHDAINVHELTAIPEEPSTLRYRLLQPKPLLLTATVVTASAAAGCAYAAVVAARWLARYAAQRMAVR